MFESEMKNPILLRNALEPITEIIDEAVLQIKEDGLKILAADRAVVVVVDFEMSKKCFDKYKLTENIEIGLNLTNFLQILKRAGSSDKLKLKTDGQKLEIIFENGSERKFQIPTISLSGNETPDVSKLEFKNIIKTDASIINNAINDADLIADSMVFSIDESAMRISASSDSTSVNIVVPKKKLKKFGYVEDARSRFSLEYLKKIIKASKIADEAEISIGTDYPMRLIFADKNIKISFILAPRVED
ncbi:MAG: hypothetical protein J7J92_01705 [Candidatus Aenigmarchaeota archaeon]|nr:hypothetical protein [Candidatus Aenigmarchaeota archaeon]